MANEAGQYQTGAASGRLGQGAPKQESATNVINLMAALKASVANAPHYQRAQLASSHVSPSTDQQQRGAPMATEGEVRAAEIAAAEARTDTKIARLEGKIDLVLSKLDAANANSESIRRDVKESERAIRANAWVIFGALIVIVGILYTAAPVILDLGFKWKETISKEIHEQVQKAAPPEKK